MKAFRDSYGQNPENLKDLGSRYKNLPAGWKFRVATLEKDLVLAFENTFDYMGDGSSNYVP